MSLITISRGSYSYGKRVAEGVAKCLGIECVSREILLQASEHYNIPEVYLTNALQKAPSVLERFTFGKERYIAYIEEAFLDYMSRDNVVYHGFAGHFFLKDVAHALKIRIIADMEERIKVIMRREGVSRDKAADIIHKIDHDRKMWSLSLYGVDTFDPSLYDMVINIHKMSVEDAVEIICRTGGMPRFQKTPESESALNDLLLAARARVLLHGRHYFNVQVTCTGGIILVSVLAPLGDKHFAEEIQEILKDLKGVREVRVETRSPEM